MIFGLIVRNNAVTNLSLISLDLNSLQQALSIEAEKGFSNLQGKQFLFADFLAMSLQQELPESWEASDRLQAQTLASQFAKYQELSLGRRQHLIAETRRLLYEVRRREIAEASPAPVAKIKKPKTEAIAATEPKSEKKITLDMELKYLEGGGSYVAQKFKLLELNTVRDVLSYYHRDHIDYARQIPIRDLKDGDTVTVIGTIKKFNCFTSPKNPNLTIVEIILRDHTGQIKLSRFWTGKRYANRGWQETQKKLYPQGCTVAASGVVKQSKYGLTLENYEVEVLEHTQDTIQSKTVGRVVPVYPLTEGITPEAIRRLVVQCLPAVSQIVDPMPDRLLSDYKMMPLAEAIAQVHYPDNSDRLEQSVIRLTFDKYFYRRLVSLYRRQQQKAIHFVPQTSAIAELEKLLPFELTNAQKRVVAEIRADLQGNTPMNRLVQGDVGSGKTIVAVYALLTAIEAGYQTALMAPTEVLTEQHYRKIVEWFMQLNLPVELLTGSTKTAKRREILRQLATGELPLVIGTHALIQDTVNFARLGLAVIDEQHRFGRDQRSRLLQKGTDPHVLIMTATPIPRTLYLTNSEIEVSIIDELPPGRKPIQTVILKPSQRKDAYDLMRREIAPGRQVYIVFPLVEE